MVRISVPPNRGAASSAPLSDSITVARVIGIMGIVYAHAWTGLPGSELLQLRETPQGILHWLLVELLGRNAVPLLSSIAGYLVIHSVQQRSWRSFVRSKTRPLLAPMVLWNAIAITLVSSAAWFGWILAPMPTDWWWTLDELFCLITPNDINVQTAFLRDLFLCMLIAPSLVRLSSAMLGIIIALTLAWIVSPLNPPILLRPAILLFFVVGMLVQRHHGLSQIAGLHIRPIVLSYIALVLCKVLLERPDAQAQLGSPALLLTVEMTMRLASALILWRFATYIALTKPRLRNLLKSVEPYIFLMFCFHLIVLWLGGPAIGRLTGPLGEPYYPLYLMLQPVLALAASIALGHLLLSLSPATAKLLSGGRLQLFCDKTDQSAADRRRTAKRCQAK